MAKKKRTTPRVYVHLTARWGNGDADSTIKISRKRWAAIQAGAEYAASAWSWYEGERSSISWSFANGKVSINGEDGMQCSVEEPIDSLYVDIS